MAAARALIDVPGMEADAIANKVGTPQTCPCTPR